MENAPSEQKKNKHLIKILIIIVIIGVLLSIVLVTKNQQSPANNENQNTQASTEQTPQFQKATLSDLVSGKISSGSLVEVQGTVTQKGEFTYNDTNARADNTNYFLKITDGGATALVVPKDNILADYNVGDVIAVQGVNGVLGDCVNPDDAQVQKICQEFKMNETNTRMIAPVGLTSTSTGITIVTKATKTSSSNTISKSSYSPSSTATSPASKPTIPLTYSQIMNGLSGTLTMGSFSNYNNQGYSSDNSNILVVLMIDGQSKTSISGVSLEMFDPSVGYDSRLTSFPSDFSQYRTLHNQILAQILTNIFPDWADGVQWVNGAISSCKQDGTEQSTVQDSMKITANCSTTLGAYGIEIGHNN